MCASRCSRHAADLIEAAPEDLVIEDGAVLVRGAPSKRVSLAEVAAAALERGGPVDRQPQRRLRAGARSTRAR